MMNDSPKENKVKEVKKGREREEENDKKETVVEEDEKKRTKRIKFNQISAKEST